MSNNLATRSWFKVAGLVGAGVLAGAALAATGVASAATSGTTSAAPSGTRAAGAMGHGGATPVRSDEKQVTGTQADTLKAAALKAVPGATVYRIETDAGDGTYEVHLTRSDGTDATVKFDANLKVVKVETGMGRGDPAPAGAPGPAPAGAPGQAPSGTAGSTSSGTN